MHDGQSGVVGSGPDGMEVRVIDGVIKREFKHDAARPTRAAPGLDLADGILDIAGARADEGGKAVRVAPADVVQESVDRADHASVDAQIVVAGERAVHHEFDVHAFLVHLPDTGLDVPVLGVARWVDAALEVLEVAVLLLTRPGLAKVARFPTPPSASALEAVPVGERGFEYLPGTPGLHLAQELSEFRLAGLGSRRPCRASAFRPTAGGCVSASKTLNPLRMVCPSCS